MGDASSPVHRTFTRIASRSPHPEAPFDPSMVIRFSLSFHASPAMRRPAISNSISILALSFVPVSNRCALSIIFRQDLQDPKWLAERRAHADDMILQYLKS